MRKCIDCREELPATLEFFGPRKSVKAGLTGHCRACDRKRQKAWRDANHGKVIAHARKRYDEKKDDPEYQKAAALRAAKWAKDNRERYNANVRKGGAKWRAKNKEYLAQKRREYRDRIKSDPKLRIVRNMPIYMRQSLKGVRRFPHWERRVGYTRDDLIRHLERQFTDGMNWENFGTAWHIDHIVPIKSFNFSSYDDQDFRACWALTNLRPLPKLENLAKSSRRLHLL